VTPLCTARQDGSIGRACTATASRAGRSTCGRCAWTSSHTEPGETCELASGPARACGAVGPSMTPQRARTVEPAPSGSGRRRPPRWPCRAFRGGRAVVDSACSVSAVQAGRADLPRGRGRPRARSRGWPSIRPYFRSRRRWVATFGSVVHVRTVSGSLLPVWRITMVVPIASRSVRKVSKAVFMSPVPVPSSAPAASM